MALELDRERSARAKADRQVEALQKTVDAVREAEATSKNQAQQQLEVERQREEGLQARLALAEAELAAMQRLAELRTLDDIRNKEVAATAKEVVGLRASLERLATLVAASPDDARDPGGAIASTRSGRQLSPAVGSQRKRRPDSK